MTGAAEQIQPLPDRGLDGRHAVAAAQRYLLSIQQADGHWCGELEGDTILESEFVLVMHFVGRGGEKRRKASNQIRGQQLDSGGWAIYPGGPPDVSASVKAYFVLKLSGDDADAPHMVRARRVILSCGGLDACNSFTKIYLAIFGQYDWSKCPWVPPEIILLPRWFYINLYDMSSWSRAIIVPLSIVRTLQPSCAVPERANIRELVAPNWRAPDRSLWTNLFVGLSHGRVVGIEDGKAHLVGGVRKDDRLVLRVAHVHVYAVRTRGHVEEGPCAIVYVIASVGPRSRWRLTKRWWVRTSSMLQKRVHLGIVRALPPHPTIATEPTESTDPLAPQL